MDNSSLILSELQALRAEFNEHAQRTGERLSSLETDMHALVGNGQPGRVRLLEMAVARLERWRWYVAGIAGTCAAGITLIFKLLGLRR